MYDLAVLAKADRNASWCVTESPIGPLTLVGTARGLEGLLFENEAKICGSALSERIYAPDLAVFRQAERELREYFSGDRRTFSLPLVLNGTTFQRAVWQALLEIPYGETTTYGSLAAQLGRPGSARAVGSANARNPIAIIVPCHRVVGSTGQLTGFGGGLTVKDHLLRHERALAIDQPLPFKWMLTG